MENITPITTIQNVLLLLVGMGEQYAAPLRPLAQALTADPEQPSTPAWDDELHGERRQHVVALAKAVVSELCNLLGACGSGDAVAGSEHANKAADRLENVQQRTLAQAYARLACAVLELVLHRIAGRETQATLLTTLTQVALGSSQLLLCICDQAIINSSAVHGMSSSKSSSSQQSQSQSLCADNTIACCVRANSGSCAEHNASLQALAQQALALGLGTTGLQCNHSLSELPNSLCLWLEAQQCLISAAARLHVRVKEVSPLWLCLKVSRSKLMRAAWMHARCSKDCDPNGHNTTK